MNPYAAKLSDNFSGTKITPRVSTTAGKTFIETQANTYRHATNSSVDFNTKVGF